MTDLSSRMLSKIEEHRITALPFLEDLTMPFYDGLSLVNIPGTITRLLDVPDFGKPPLNEAILNPLGSHYNKIVLLLVDALGYNLLGRLMSQEDDMLWRRYVDRAVYSPITSICPSTTASALTSLWTGEGPATHGVIGYEMWAKEFGMVINNIRHSSASSRGDTGGLARSGFDPLDFIKTPLLGAHLRQHDIHSNTFIHSSIAHSGLSVMQMEDVNVHAYIDEADLCVNLAEFINRRQGVREYIYVYYSDVDTLMHHYSDEDTRIALQFGAFSSLFEKAFLGNLSTAALDETLLILTADHGSKTTPQNPHYDLNNHPDLVECLVMQPTCEHRMAFFFIKPGKIQTVRDYFDRVWPEKFYLVDPEIALESGLFGQEPFHEKSRERIGDLIAIARDDAYLWWAHGPNLMAGRHGGLSREEMLVPFYGLPLKKVAQEFR